MAPPNSNRWTTDPEYVDLMNFLIETTKETKTPRSLNKFAEEFRKKSKSSVTNTGLQNRIQKFRPRIHEMDNIDTDTKVRLLFGLSVPIENDFLEKLKTQADVVLDDHQRIVKYKTHGGVFELSGTHRAMAACDRIIERNKKMMEFLVQKAMEADSPIPLQILAREFKEATGTTRTSGHLVQIFMTHRDKIYKSTDFDENTKLRMMFVSSASVPDCFLELLQKDALVEVDENNRVTKYKANDGSLTLTGDHSPSAKIKAGNAAKRKKSHEARVSTGYDSDIESDNDGVDHSSEEFATDSNDEDCQDGTEKIIDPVDLDDNIPVRRRTPLEMSIEDGTDYNPLTRRFHRDEESEKKEKRTGRTYNRNMNPESDEDEVRNTEEQVTTRSGRVSRKRVLVSHYVMDESEDDEALPPAKSKKSSSAASTSSKRKKNSETIKSASDDLMRPELDDYDPSYSIHRTTDTPTESPAKIRENEEDKQDSGESSQTNNKSSTAPTLSEKKRKTATEESSSSKLANPSLLLKTNELDDNDKSKESNSAVHIAQNSDSTKNNKKRKTSITGASFSKRIYPSSDDYMGQDELDDFDPNHSVYRTAENPIELQAGIRENEIDEQDIGGLSQSPAVLKSSKKKRKADVEGSNPPKLGKSSPAVYDPNQSSDDSSRVEFKPFRGSLLDNAHLISMDDDIQVLETPPAPAAKDSEMIETPIKPEDPGTPQKDETLGKKGNSVKEEVKPKFTSQLMLLKVIKSLIDTLDTSSLSQMKSKIRQKIWKIGESDKGISNEEMILAMELLVSRMTNHSVTGLSETAESVNLNQFLCYLKATILNLKLEGLDSLLEKIKGRIKEPTSKEKSIPVEKVESVLQTTLDVIGF